MTSKLAPALASSDWNLRYAEKNHPWDLSSVTPEFVRLYTEKRFLLPQKKCLIPGSGYGHDALFLAKQGLAVSVVEFASLANENVLEKAQAEKLSVQVFQKDFFTLAQEAYHQSRYDIFLEYTFFCAIEPSLRKNYVQAARSLLAPKGILLGLFFPLDGRAGGPPFSSSQEEITELFSPYFTVEWETPVQSVKPRHGKELLGIFTKK